MERCEGCNCLTGVPRYVDERTLCTYCAEGGNPRRDVWREGRDMALGWLWVIAFPILVVWLTIALLGPG